MMIDQLPAILDHKVNLDEIQSVAYDSETIKSDSGEIITQLRYFSIDTTYGEYIEIHSDSDDEKYALLYGMFYSQLPDHEESENVSLELYQANK
ncbi:hypothetical protein ACX93W_04310 [Paenibacillus sp. CAU 1782]